MSSSAEESTATNAVPQPLVCAWISDYPIEWMPDPPDALRGLRRQHPTSWARVLLEQFEQQHDVLLHVIVLRSRIAKSFSFERGRTRYHVVKASALGRILSLFWLDTLLIRRVLRRIAPDVVHAWGTERAAALVASRLHVPYVVTLQGILEWYARETPPPDLFQRLVTKLEPISLRRARVVTSESTFGVGFLRNRYPQAEVRQIEHSPSPVFHQVERQPRLHPLRLLNVGTLGPRKGTDLLLRALGRLMGEVDFDLVLVGDENRDYLDSLKPSLPPSLWQRVTLKSELSAVEVAAELAQAALFILPTRADTSPNAVKEAAVAGVPVVASAVGGIPDYITHGENGLLCKPGDLEALVTTLREALRHPLFGRGQVEPMILSRLRRDLSPGEMGSRFLEVYKRTLAVWERDWR